MKKSSFFTLSFGLFLLFAPYWSQAQTIIDFNSAKPEVIGNIKKTFGDDLNEVSVADGFLFTISGTLDDLDVITLVEGKGHGGTKSLHDNNFDIGGITRWTIRKKEGATFQFRGIYLKDAGAGGSVSGTITAYKESNKMGTSVAVNFDGSYNQSFATNADFFDIDEIRIEAADINFYLDDFTFGPPRSIGTNDPAEVLNITLIGNPTSTVTTVSCLVTFSKDVTNVDITDFQLTKRGSASAFLSSVSGSGSIYTVVVTNIAGEGSLQLDLKGDSDIETTDGKRGTATFIGGQVHDIGSCFTETFDQGETKGAKAFSGNGKTFSLIGNWTVNSEIPFTGINGSSFNLKNNGAGPYSIKVNSGVIAVSSLYLYVSSMLDGASPTNYGSVTMRGLLAGNEKYRFTKSGGFASDFDTNSGYTFIDFSTEGLNDFSEVLIDQLEISIGGSFTYLNLDNFNWCQDFVPPSGYTVTVDQDPITVLNETAVGFTFAGAEIGTFYTYTFSSSGGGTAVSGAGTISIANHQVTGIDLGNLEAGTVTLSVTLTDASGNAGAPATTTVQKIDNNAPTDIDLDKNIVNQSEGENAIVGILTSEDVDDTHTYELVAGEGDTDNSSFNIDGSTLRANNALLLSAGTYNLRIRTIDSYGASYEKSVEITVVDNIAPTISSVTVPANGSYGIGELLTFTVNVSENVSVTNNPRIPLIVGGASVYASYISGSGTSILVFGHTIQPGESDNDGIELGEKGIQLNGGTISDGTNLLNLILNNVGNMSDVLVDGIAPSGYTASIDQNILWNDNQTAVSFSVSGAELNTQYHYSFTSSGGGSSVIGTGTVSTSTFAISNIDLTALPVGTITLSFTLKDGSRNVGTAAEDEVQKVFNNPPVVSNPIADQSVNEDLVFSFQFAGNTFSDHDVGDLLIYTAQLAGGGALPTWLSFDAATRTFSGTPNNDDVGELSLEVTATDIFGISASNQFEITVINVNDQPVVENAISDQTATQDIAFDFQFDNNTFSDPDVGDVLTYSSQLTGGRTLPTWLDFDATTRSFSGTPSNNDVGTLIIEIVASDGNGGSVTTSFDIIVLNVNDLPVVENTIPDQTATQDIAFSFQFAANTFRDPDAGNVLTYSAQLAGGGSFPTWLSFDAATRTFSGTAGNDDVGSLTIEVTASDGNGGSVSALFDITVLNVNDQPMVENVIPDQSGTQDIAFDFQFDNTTFSDPDVGDVLTYSAQLTGGGALPTWLSFDAATRTFSGTPSNNDVGTLIIEIVASDGNGGSVTTSFDIKVLNVNDAPVVTTSGGSTTFTEPVDGDPIPIAIDNGLTVEDIDNVGLSSATVSIIGNFKSEEDALIFTNNGGSMGDISGSYNASTGRLILTSIGAATITEWQAALRVVSYSNRSSNPNTAVRTISFVVNDGEADSSPATKTLILLAVNTAPIAQDDDFATIEVMPVSGNVLTNDTDVEGNELTASLVTAPLNGTVVLNADGNFTYTPKPDYNGSDSFQYEVCDNGSPARCHLATVYFTIEAVEIPTTSAIRISSELGDTVNIPAIPIKIELDKPLNRELQTVDFLISNGSLEDFKKHSSAFFENRFFSHGDGNAQLKFPEAIDFDAKGNFYIADSHNNRIQIFNSDGSPKMRFGESGGGNKQFSNPNGIALATNGDIYVSDQYNHRIQVFANDGTFKFQFGTYGSALGQFGRPSDMKINNDGVLYVADKQNNRIQLFKLDGTSLGQFGQLGSGDGELNFPSGLTLDSDGNIYVADTYNHRIQVFNPDGTFKLKFGSEGNGASQFSYPQEIAVDEVGNIYVAGSGTVKIFSSNGDYKGDFGSWGTREGEFYQSSAFALRNGKAYIGDNLSMIHIFKLNEFYTATLKPEKTGKVEVTLPEAVAMDAKGNPNQKASFSIIFDDTPPQLLSVRLLSTNPDPAYAKVGDVVTLEFVVDEEIKNALAIISENYVEAKQKNGSTNTWEASYTMQNYDVEGKIEVTIFPLTDKLGNTGLARDVTEDINTVWFDPTAPAIPFGLKLENRDKGLALSWEAVRESDTKSYMLYGGTDLNNLGLLEEIPVGTTSYLHDGLLIGTTYFYQLSAKDRAGNESLRSQAIYQVAKADQTISFDKLEEKVFGNEPFALNAKSTSGEEVIYKSSDESIARIEKGIVSILSTGKVTITASVGESEKFNATPAIKQELIITKANITGIAFEPTNFVYDGTEKSIQISGVLPAGMSVSYNLNTRINVGVQKVIATIEGGNNYNPLVLEAELNITRAAAVITADAVQTHVYDGKVKNIIASLNHTEAVLEYSQQPGYTNAGTYTITISSKETANYEGVRQTVQLIIERSSDFGNLVLNNKSVNYDGKAHFLELENMPAGTSVSYKNNGQTNAGTYTITAHATNPNYQDSTMTGILTIAKANITGIAFEPTNFVYDGTEKSIQISGVLPAGMSVSYNLNTRINVGMQKVIATIEGGDNYNPLVLEAELKITRAAAVITADAVQTHVYDGKVKNIIASLNHTEAVLEYSQQPGYTNVGNYIIKVSSEETANYHAVDQDVRLVISSSKFDGLKFTDKTVIYTGAAQNLLVENLPSGSQVSYTGNGQTDVGEYTVNATVKNLNYQEKTMTAKLVIKKASQKISFEELGSVTRNANQVAMNVSTTSGLPVTVTSDDPLVATIQGGQLLIHRLGTVRLTAIQEGDKNHEAAAPVEITVRVTDELVGPIKVHPAFSPNGDGINDFLIIEGIKDFPENKIRIVTRNGMEVFKIEGYDNDNRVFRGTGNTHVANGTLPEGTYFYLMEYKEDGKWKMKNGWFVLKVN